MRINLTPAYEFRYSQITNHNFCFVMLNENNQALHTPFMCKDYFQDMMYAEVTGKSAGIYGITWKQGMWNINVPRFRIALLGGNVELKSAKKDLLTFLNCFESALGFSLSKIYVTPDPKVIVVDFSKEWTANGPLFSAFTTLLRLGGAYKAGEDVLEYLKTLHSKRENSADYPGYMRIDMLRLDVTLKRFAALLVGLRPEHKWEDFISIMQVHDTGIAGFKAFPEVEVK